VASGDFLDLQAFLQQRPEVEGEARLAEAGKLCSLETRRVGNVQSADPQFRPRGDLSSIGPSKRTVRPRVSEKTVAIGPRRSEASTVMPTKVV